MKNKNKKAQGLLSEETLKIVIALIGIGLLAVLIFALWNARKNATELGQAKASLAHLDAELSNEVEQIEIFSPLRWGIISFTSSEKMPDFCTNLNLEKCICMCKPGGAAVTTYKLACLSGGASVVTCIENDFQINLGVEKSPTILKVDYTTKKITT